MLRSCVSLLVPSIFFILYYTGCSEDTTSPINSNEIRAEIIKFNGDTLSIISRGDSTFFGCSILGTEINGLSNNNSFLTLSIQLPPTGCVTAEGVYSFLCKYYKDKSNPSAAVFSNYEIDPGYNGAITFTKITGQLIEGTFTAIGLCEFQTNCIHGKDSVLIKGSFRADHF